MDESWKKALWGSLYPLIQKLEGDKNESRGGGRIQYEYYVDQEPFVDYMPTLGKEVTELAKKDPDYMLLLHASTLCQMVYVVLCCFVHYVPSSSPLCQEIIVNTYKAMFDTASSHKMEKRMTEIIIDVVVKDMLRRSSNEISEELTTSDLKNYVSEISKHKNGVTLMDAKVPSAQNREIYLYDRLVNTAIVGQRCDELIRFYNKITDTVLEIAESLPIDVPLEGITKRTLTSSQLKQTVLTPIVDGVVKGVKDSFVFEARGKEMNMVHMLYVSSTVMESATLRN